jgi:uncharacterized OB-fold protein
MSVDLHHTELLPVAPGQYRFGPAGEVTILGSRGDADGVLFYPPRLSSPTDGGAVSEVELPTTGTLWTWTYVHAPWPGDTSPSGGAGYAAGLVDLDRQGPRIAAVLLGGPEDWTIGMRLRACALPLATTTEGTRCVLAFAADQR